MSHRGPVSRDIKRGAVYGAFAGIAVGFLYLGLASVPEDRFAAVWRNFVLAGIGLGTLAGLIRAWTRRSRSD